MKHNAVMSNLVAGLVLSLPTMGLAGTLKIDNENNKPLVLYITPEGAGQKEKYKTTIPADSKGHIIEKNLENNDGKNYFEIEGGTTKFTPKGTCRQLSVEKNYHVTFQNDTIGTTCLAEELSD